MAKRSRLPGQYRTRFTVDIEDPGSNVGDDGRRSHSWMDSAGLMAKTTYVGDLERHDGRWTLGMQWIDSSNQSHKYYLPHDVVHAIRNAMERILKQSRSSGAQQAAATRKERGVIPFQARSVNKGGK
jgi:hypothetical protein